MAESINAGTGGNDGGGVGGGYSGGGVGGGYNGGGILGGGFGIEMGGESWSVEKRFRVTEVFLGVLWVSFCGFFGRACVEEGKYLKEGKMFRKILWAADILDAEGEGAI